MTLTQVVRVQVMGDSDAESDSEVTAEIMDVTKSITQQIMDSAVKDKHEVRNCQLCCNRNTTYPFFQLLLQLA